MEGIKMLQEVDVVGPEPLDAATTLKNARLLRDEIAGLGVEIDQARRLPDEIVARMKSLGILRAAAPRSRGGSELDPMTQVQILEELARGNGSVAWVAMVGMDSGYFSSWAEREVSDQVWADPDALTCGQLRNTSPAISVVRESKGYRVKGRFNFGSGVLHADVIVAGCLAPTAGGEPERRVMIVDRDSVEVLDTWHTLGLRGTGSHDYVVDGLIPYDRSFVVPSTPKLPGPLYSVNHGFLDKFPGWALGTARAAIDFATQWVLEDAPAGSRESEFVQKDLADAETALGSARAYVMSTLERSWEVRQAGGEESSRLIAELQLARNNVWPVARSVVDQMCRLVGSRSIRDGSALDRLQRDVLTASTHVYSGRATLMPAARRLVGLEPQHPLL